VALCWCENRLPCTCALRSVSMQNLVDVACFSCYILVQVEGWLPRRNFIRPSSRKLTGQIGVDASCSRHVCVGALSNLSFDGSETADIVRWSACTLASGNTAQRACAAKCTHAALHCVLCCKRQGLRVRCCAAGAMSVSLRVQGHAAHAALDFMSLCLLCCVLESSSLHDAMCLSFLAVQRFWLLWLFVGVAVCC
jgi:hypothetical protein